MSTETTIAPQAAKTAEKVLLGRQAPPATLVIFGAGGDLTKRLVVPALYNLVQARKLPDEFAIIGVDQDDRTTEQWRQTPDRDDAGVHASRRDRRAGMVIAHPSHALYARRLYAA